MCAQPVAGGTTTGVEDCLFLNIWSHDDDIVRPVIVFNHGGSANGVGGSNGTLDGTTLATDGDAIVVTLNRRLGALGYLAIDELIQESPRTTAGNYAVLDVIAALEWLVANVESFNGDPARIMLAGQVCGWRGFLRRARLAGRAGPFQFRGTATRGAADGGRYSMIRREFRPMSPMRSTNTANSSRTSGCDASGDVMGCLRALSAEEIILGAESVDADFNVVIDGDVIAGTIQDSLAMEVAGSVPIIIGSTADEMINILGPNPVADDAEYRQFLEFVFEQPLSDDLYALYPTADFDSASDALLTLFGDLLFNCVAEDLADNAETGAPAYLFHFNRGFDNGPFGGNRRLSHHRCSAPCSARSISGVTRRMPRRRRSARQCAVPGWILSAIPSVAPSYLSAPATAWPAYFSMDQQIVEYGETIDIATEHRAGRCPSLRALL